MSRRAVLAALPLALAAACSRPPRGMTRLDAGSDNHNFRLDADGKRLYYVEGGGRYATRLHVLNLDTGARAAYRFPHQQIIGLAPSSPGDVTLATSGSGVDNEDEERLLLVEGGSGRVLRDEVRFSIKYQDLLDFARAAPRRGERYVARGTLDGRWLIEELEPRAKTRRVVATFPTAVESMAPAGVGLAVLRRAGDGTGRRKLAMVNASTARVDLELPWNDGESELLGADTPKHLLYIRMNEGDNDTAWAVHFDEPALRAASDYLSRRRGSGVRKLIGEDIVGFIILGGFLVLLAGLFIAKELNA